MRLTNKTELDINKEEPMIDIRNKLWELENIEEEIGIDLITLFNAFKNGIYVKSYDNPNSIYKMEVKWDWCYPKNYFKFRYGTYYFKDYGITWALTKKELENTSGVKQF